VRLGFFLIISYFTTRLKDSSEKLKVALDKEKTLSRTDSLTKILNRRAFTESAETEIYRARRYKHPFTIVFMDLDNFKAVNDTFGHSAGDKLLDLVAQTIKNNMRSSDLIGRLGGDEFSILMPETGFESADISMRRLQLKLLDIMQRNGWPVTFSIGMVTYTTPPDSIEDIIRKADSVMYSVKNNGKNMIAHEVLS
jgi:diguanylate cyclase (GGDEF)-like protein